MTDAMYADRGIQSAIMRRNDFLREVQSLKEAKNDAGEKLFTDVEIAEHFGISITHLRKKISIVSVIETGKMRLEALDMEEAGKTRSEIASELGLSESTVRAMLM